MLPRFQRFVLRGPPLLQLQSLTRFVRSAVAVTVGRLVRGPLLPSWSYEVEFTTHFFKSQCDAAYRLASAGKVAECRQTIDGLIFRTTSLREVAISPDIVAPVPGQWFASKRPGPVVLYLHGGGFAFFPAMTDNLIAALALAVGGRTFVPHYRLAPEHPYPAQLDDALKSYRWLLDQHVPPSRLVLAGDSAGGHLVLCLLMALRDTGLPLPAAAVALSPWIDPGNRGDSMLANERYDWMTKAMADQLGAWAGASGERSHPLFRLLEADLSALAPVLIQSGGVEIFHDMIEAFRARHAVANDVTFDLWPEMNHDFQGFGDLVAESKQALDRIASFVSTHCAGLD